MRGRVLCMSLSDRARAVEVAHNSPPRQLVIAQVAGAWFVFELCKTGLVELGEFPSMGSAANFARENSGGARVEQIKWDENE
jgi:hypothetical protein